MKGTELIFAPHRLLINHSLRKEGEKLRDHIDRYQEEYASEIEQCRAAIEMEMGRKDALFQEETLRFEEELRKDQKFFEELGSGVGEYIELYYQQKCFYNIYQAQRTRLLLINENIYFLTAQIHLIDQEIDVLGSRLDTLSQMTNIEDIKYLLRLSDFNAEMESVQDVQNLLQKVQELLSEAEEGRRYALNRLRQGLQKRSDYMAEIQYTKWVIAQKRQLRRECAERRRNVYLDKEQCEPELKEAQSKLNQINQQMRDKAIAVRSCWEKPIADLSERIKRLESNPKVVEYQTLKKRLAQLYRNEDMQRQRRDYEAKAAETQKEKESVQKAYEARIEEAKRKAAQTDVEYSEAKNELKWRKGKDTRSFLAKIFSDTPSVAKAREHLKRAEQERDHAKKHLDGLSDEEARELASLDHSLRQERPKEYTPTDKEYEEIAQLMGRKKELRTEFDCDAVLGEIRKLRSERSVWMERRSMVYSLCKKQHIFGLFEKGEGTKNGLPN